MQPTTADNSTAQMKFDIRILVSNVVSEFATSWSPRAAVQLRYQSQPLRKQAKWRTDCELPGRVFAPFQRICSGTDVSHRRTNIVPSRVSLYRSEAAHLIDVTPAPRNAAAVTHPHRDGPL